MGRTHLYFLVYIFSLFLFASCEQAKFDAGGDVSASGVDVTGFEVVDEPDGGITEEPANTNNGGEDSEDSDNDDDDDNNESVIGDRCEECVISPDELYEEDSERDQHSCDNRSKDHKVNICQWPSGDESKEHTLCVAKASLEGNMRMRRQDRYFVGACPSDEED